MIESSYMQKGDQAKKYAIIEGKKSEEHTNHKRSS